MTGPNPDAELDEALGVDQLPPAAVTDAHRAEAAELYLACRLPATRRAESEAALAQALADEGQRAVARYIAEHTVAGT